MNAYIPYDAPLLFDTPEQISAFDKAYAFVMKGPTKKVKSNKDTKKTKTR
jgi:hypothetical protein